MKRIVIHAGLPKTGSTFLQENVFPSIPNQVCAYNPESLRRLLVRMCKQVVVRGELSSEEIASLKKQVDQEINQQAAETVFISIEGLLPLHSGGISTGINVFKVLKQLINDATIIIFIREQSAWLRSAYSFYLVNGYIFPFEEFVNKASGENTGFTKPVAGQLGINVYGFDCQDIKSIAENYFQQVVCIRFEDLFSEKQNMILSQLALILGLETLKPCASQAVNKGLDERLMVIASKVIGSIPFRSKWQLNYLYTHYAQLKPADVIKRTYLKYSGNIALKIARLLHRYTAFAKEARLFSVQDEAHIKNFYLEKNSAFWQKNL